MERLTAGGFRDLAEHAGPALAKGCAQVISVVAIRDRSGAKWGRKCEQVSEFVERAFQRAAPGGGLVVALNDVEFLLVHADTNRWTALHLSAGILRETLRFFLGHVERADLRLMEVTGFSDQELSLKVIDTERLEADDAIVDELREPYTEEPAVGGALLLPWTEIPGPVRTRRVRLVAGALEVETLHLLQPVWNVRNRAVTSFLVETTTSPHPISDLPPPMAAAVARSSLTFAAEQIGACRRAGASVALHVPVPLDTLGVGLARYSLISLLKDLPHEVQRLLVLELINVPAGVPQGRLSEAVAMLAPYTRATLARAQLESAQLRHWRDCGLNGITLDCRDIDPSDRTALTRLSRFARDSLAFAPACVGYSLGAMSLLVSAWGAGFTHLSGAAVSTRVSELAAVRLAPRQLYDGALSRRVSPAG